MTNRLAEHLEDPISEERLEQMWQSIDARREEYQPSAKRKQAVIYASGFAVAAGVALGWFFGSPLHDEQPSVVTVTEPAADHPSWEAGAALRTAGEKMSVDLPDGSKVTLAPRSRVAMQETQSDDIALNLQQGRVACSVSKDQKRLFSVVAGEVTVQVVGTVFAVERTPLASGERVAVDVTEGIVEVRGPDGVHKRLSAGESWSVKIAPQAQERSETAAEAHASKAAPSTPTVQKSGLSKKKRDEEEAARDLFAQARAKRNSGDAAGAAQLYQQFLSLHAKDPRSGLAALELGRLKMDQLGDVAGAIRPLSQAARGAGSLGDDALARLVQAYAQLGQTGACKTSRARYLQSFPNGVHVDQVRALCP